MNYNVFAIFISPTGNTKEVVRSLAKGISDQAADGDFFSIDLTSRSLRSGVLEFGPGDIVIIGVPTYAGRVPNKLLPYLTEAIYGDGAYAIPIVTYGNRAFDDSLKELASIMYNNGMDLIGAAAAVGEHAFTSELAGGRPNEEDLALVYDYGKRLGEKLKAGREEILDPDSLPGHPVEEFEYYAPKKEDGSPASFLKAMPVTDIQKCTQCGECRDICPMGCYRMSLSEPEGTCIKCQGCIHTCPVGAKSFENEDLKSHIRMLEENFKDVKRDIFFA